MLWCYYFNQPLFSHIFIVVSDLVKKKHTLKDVPLTVFPGYDDFEELEEKETISLDYYGYYHVEPLVMNYLIFTHDIDNKVDFESMKFRVVGKAQLHLAKQFDDFKDAEVFKNKLKDLLQSFVKEEVRIPKTVFEKVKEKIESQRDEFEDDNVDFNFHGFRVTLVGKKEDVVLKKRSIEATIDRISEEAKFVSEDLVIDNQNKLKFLYFINYFENVKAEFPGVKNHDTQNSFGQLSILAMKEKIKDVKLRIYQDIARISEIVVKTSFRQIDFLQRTQCKIVNDELKKDDAMLLLVDIEGAVGVKDLQAKIMTLKKRDDDEVIYTIYFYILLYTSIYFYILLYILYTIYYYIYYILLYILYTTIYTIYYYIYYIHYYIYYIYYYIYYIYYCIYYILLYILYYILLYILYYILQRLTLST